MTTTANAIEFNSYHINKPTRATRLDNLQELITALNICKGNYETLAKTTQLSDLKEVCDRFAAKRANYISSLHNRFDFDNSSTDQVSWTNTIHHMDEANDAIILDAIIASELSAEKMYNIFLRNHIPTIEQLEILVSQKDSVKKTVSALLDLKTKHGLFDSASA